MAARAMLQSATLEACSVEVIHAQNCSQKLALARLSKVVVMILIYD
jgi:hypothetical protein